MKLFFWKKSTKPEVKKEVNTRSKQADPPVSKNPFPQPLRAIPRAGADISKSTEKISRRAPTDDPNRFRERKKSNFVVKRNAIEGSLGSQRKGITSVSMKPKPQETIIQNIAGATQHRVLPIKRWCERELTPVAWARVLVRILPVLRQYGYNFAEMQNPAPDTQVKEDFFLVLSATIQEIYELPYEESTAA